MLTSIFFLAPNSLLALIMAKHFQSFTGENLKNVMSAYTENDCYIISGDVSENAYIQYCNDGIQELTKETGFLYSIQTVDEEFKMYRITMM